MLLSFWNQSFAHIPSLARHDSRILEWFVVVGCSYLTEKPISYLSCELFLSFGTSTESWLIPLYCLGLPLTAGWCWRYVKYLSITIVCRWCFCISWEWKGFLHSSVIIMKVYALFVAHKGSLPLFVSQNTKSYMNILRWPYVLENSV